MTCIILKRDCEVSRNIKLFGVQRRVKISRKRSRKKWHCKITQSGQGKYGRSINGETKAVVFPFYNFFSPGLVERKRKMDAQYLDG